MKKLLAACLLTTALYGAVFAETILSEGFEGTFPPDEWTQYSVEQTTTYEHDGIYSVKLGAAEDYLITPPLTNAQTLTFWTHTTSYNPDTIVETSTSVTGQWTAVTGSPLSDTAENWNEWTLTLVSTETLYVKFRKNGTGTLYVDDVSADDTLAGNIAPVLAEIGNKAVVVSNSLSFTVSATDANGDDITLSATDLPSGAIFDTVTHAGSVSNTFSWASAAPVGVYTSTFTADDGTTNTSKTITITVSEHPVLPDNVTFNFAEDEDLYGALDNQADPITYTNSGLVATFTASDGEMNRTIDGFGLNATNFLDDTDAFDPGEWIDVNFDILVALTHIDVSSWGSNDTAVIFVDGFTNGVITSTGSHAFDIQVPAGQILRISGTDGDIGNGWSLDAITVQTGTNTPPISIDAPVLTLTTDGAQQTVNWNAVDGRHYTIWWTSSLLEQFQPQATNDARGNGWTNWTDTVNTTNGEGFYQLKVELIP